MSDSFMTVKSTDFQRTFGHRGGRAASVAGHWLCLAATPTFGIMALLAAFCGAPPDMLCVSMHHASPLTGMVPMYALMSAFHARPWLKLLFK